MQQNYVSRDENCKNCELTKHLLQKLKGLYCLKGGELDVLKLSSKRRSIENMQFIGKRSFEEVYKAKQQDFGIQQRKWILGITSFFCKKSEHFNRFKPFQLD